MMNIQLNHQLIGILEKTVSPGESVWLINKLIPKERNTQKPRKTPRKNAIFFLTLSAFDPPACAKKWQWRALAFSFSFSFYKTIFVTFSEKTVFLSSKSLDKNELLQAKTFLEQAAVSNPPEFLKALSDILANTGSSAVARIAAGLQLKNHLTSKDVNVTQEYVQRWHSFPVDTREYIKKNVSYITRVWFALLEFGCLWQLLIPGRWLVHLR